MSKPRPRRRSLSSQVLSGITRSLSSQALSDIKSMVSNENLPKAASMATTRSSTSLEGRRNSLGSRSLSFTGMCSSICNTTGSKPKDHHNFFQMISLNPSNPEERAQFDDLTVKKYIRRNPDALQVKYSFCVGGGQFKLTVSRYPLAALVALGAALSTIKLAIKTNPSALEGPQDFGSTVLHTACLFNTDMKVLRYIYNKYPSAIQETTKLVYLPLHNACAKKEPSLEMIEFLVEVYPKALLAINKLGDTPLRTAQRNQTTSPEVLCFLEDATNRVASLEENQEQWKGVSARQSWGENTHMSKCGDNRLSQLFAKDMQDHVSSSTELSSAKKNRQCP